MIRAYQAGDTFALTTAHNVLYPAQPRTPGEFGRYLAQLERNDGRIWVVTEGDTIIGYAAVGALPGLPGQVEVEGFIVSVRQRQGIGSQLLVHLLQDLRQTGVRQIFHAVTRLDSPAASFLRHHGFFVEHEEWVMQRRLDHHLPIHNDRSSPPATLQTSPLFSSTAVIHYFCQLYEQSFAGTRWFQPYTPAEVAATLVSPEDILFLWQGEVPIGFAWLRLRGPSTADIEPIGIIKSYQGQGHGRHLLLTALHRLASLGIQEVNLGVWRENETAVRLYQSLGFQHQQTLTYLAYNVS